MATLEIHEGPGKVRLVELDREHPVLLGSAASCDIVLQGGGILPVHGRIRWRGRRFKVDASPDAEFLEVNGRKIVSATLHQGDELTIGPCRLFVLTLDAPKAEAPSRSEKKRRRPAKEEEATKVFQGAVPMSSIEAPVVVTTPERRPSVFDQDDFLDDVIEIPPDEEPEVATSKRGEVRGRGREPKGPGPIARLFARWRGAREAEDAPGREVVAASPTVLALVALLGVLVGMGFWLNAIIARTIASRTYNHAIELMEDGDKATAIRDFDAFVAKNPADPRVGKARTLRALANVRQYIAVSGATWSSALDAAREMVETVGDLPEFRDEKSELADLTIRIGEGLADRAKRDVNAKALAEAESAIPLHARIAGDSAPAFLTKSRLPGVLNEARAAIRKAETRLKTLAAMDKAIEEKSASRVYKARDALLQTYGDLSKDPQLVERMVRANDLMRQAARIDPSRRPAETTERPDPLGPPTTFVLRSRTDAPGAPTAADGVVFAVADGSAYAIDGRSGAPLWRTSVGLASPFTPTPVPGDPSVLAVDARRNELTRRDARTGRLIWRQELGEAVDAPPLVLGEQVYQTLPAGRLLVIGLATGEVEAAVDLAFPVTRSPVGDESGRFLYVMGRKDCLFTIARDPLACVDVQYLGHSEGAIPCPPARLGRFLIVAENDRIRDGRWRILVLDEEGAKPRAVQSIDLPGWTWDAPPSSGSSIWAIGDRGGMEVFAAGDYASADPLRSLAKSSPDATASGPAFGLATSGREVWVAAGRSGRYDLDSEGGKLTSRFLLGDLGVAAAPVQSAGRRIIVSTQSPGGGVDLRGIDPSSGKPDWATVVGAAWPTPLIASSDGQGLEGVDRAGRRIRIARSDLEGGGFVSALLLKPGDPRAPDGRLRTVTQDGKTISVIVPEARGTEIWAEDPKEVGGWNATELPSSLATTPLPWSGGLLIPGEDGRAYLIDPLTGKSAAEPLVPEFERERGGRWLAPAALDAESAVLADDAGRIRRLVVQAAPVRRIVAEAETSLDQHLLADPACTGTAVIVATADGSIRALAGRDLSPIGSWKLDAPLLGPPHAVDGRVVAFDAAGGVLLLERDGRRAWSTSLGVPAVGAPLIRDDVLWVVDRAGRARGLAIADGREVAAIDLGVQPVGGLIAVGPDVLVPSGRGVLQPLRLERTSETRP
ncbi:outer membrane protein assembly factor BamB family protein [Paludisphaera mucosa]|uniref:PQQ-binding-like beta-propeller repeat protein n=1 Tax=Paludisphaera mucosa TaxID=3030827 RepID=A0ABT6F6X8_9BACT|nr:PQQ-binding-like beta-propeller repeat protein [Paludisphaera mucosa]MDG3003145.1 PQQ-binding-like beta-propeller repeat protein [Paludisphaera mucosa]